MPFTSFNHSSPDQPRQVEQEQVVRRGGAYDGVVWCKYERRQVRKVSVRRHLVDADGHLVAVHALVRHRGSEMPDKRGGKQESPRLSAGWKTEKGLTETVQIATYGY